MKLKETDYYKDAIGMIYADRVDITVAFESLLLSKSGKQFNEFILEAVRTKDKLKKKD